MKSIDFFSNTTVEPGKGASLADFSPEEVKRVLDFHRSFKEYAPTPLDDMKHLAKYMGLGSIYVKDESKRFGLNAFKVLGGTYAIGRLLADRLGRPFDGLTREELCSDAVHNKLGDITFVTATDGNHGRGVAWTAQQLGFKAVVYMPKGSLPARVNNILATGAQCIVTDLNYDDAVRLANSQAEKHGWIMVQDTAWDGYEDIPRWIMQGYMTMAQEVLEQLKENGLANPTHMFLQAGVGSMAGAVLGFMAAHLGKKCPITTIVEPRRASCIYNSMVAQDGQPHNYIGNMDSIMAGLCCGEPSTISWGVLRDYAEASIACAEFVAANGMRIMSMPLKGDPVVVAGESGAVTLGVLDQLCRPEGLPLKQNLKLNENSRVLVINTEGNTSPEMYRDIVWYGKYPDEKD